MKCECCSDEIPDGRFCNFCTKLYFKDFQIEKKTIKLPKKVPKKLGMRKCEKCKKEYKPRSYRQKFCSDACRPPVVLPNDSWLKRNAVNVQKTRWIF